MLGNFSYCNPTKLYFGEDSLDCLREELPKYGKNVMLVYGGGSIKRNGIYDQVVKLLDESGKNVFEDPGVMPNPTVEKLYEGCRIARAVSYTHLDVYKRQDHAIRNMMSRTKENTGRGRGGT